jgi:hypothetical protein
MLSRDARVALLTVNAAIKYGAAIKETAALLEELISLVKSIDPVAKRVVWPRPLLIYLAEHQNGICPECNKNLFGLDERRPHVDHVIPWAQGGDNGTSNLRLLHAGCNLAKSDSCNPDDVILYLQSRILNLRA